MCLCGLNDFRENCSEELKDAAIIDIYVCFSYSTDQPSISEIPQVYLYICHGMSVSHPKLCRNFILFAKSPTLSLYKLCSQRIPSGLSLSLKDAKVPLLSVKFAAPLLSPLHIKSPLSLFSRFCPFL
jgi:hypothetical protein